MEMKIKEIGDYCYFLGKSNDLKGAFFSRNEDDLYNALRIIAIGIGIPEQTLNTNHAEWSDIPPKDAITYDTIFAVTPQYKSLFIKALKKFNIKAS